MAQTQAQQEAAQEQKVNSGWQTVQELTLTWGPGWSEIIDSANDYIRETMQ